MAKKPIVVTDAYVADRTGAGMLLPKMQGIKEGIVNRAEKQYNIRGLMR